ncbi:sugar dehydrogenase complex small subunit [Vibrio nitrifigilis]|uniref:Uncharacterized protein n=1 Tax=Vibrio nitrifigilis TaxID=2789781 RepID=A0ABS0GEL9_9VIBR|nr:sugar dehydrogenase complex small subunit [Vibrio nitrifigilis]MBF9000855.1 hypothetical protein [Vibrio nitrifigilis]
MKNRVHVQNSNSSELSESNMTRRRFLSSAVATAVGGYVMLSVPKVSFAADFGSLSPELQKIAALLTAKPIDPALAARASEALAKVDPQFPAHFSDLATFLKDHHITSLEELKVQPAFTGQIKTTAQSIISAFYLGYVGTPVAHSSEDNVEFVTYTQALTYQLTKPYTPIPSYSRWQTGYWEHVPNTPSFS